MAYGYRLLLHSSGSTYALAEMDPDRLNVTDGHRNVWVEAPVEQRADWLALFGPAQVVTNNAVWNSFSNDPNRIGTFPHENDPTQETPPAATPVDTSAIAHEVIAEVIKRLEVGQ